MSTQVFLPAAAPRRRHFELALTLLVLLAAAAVFWSQQRYPSLLHKLHAGSAIQAKGALSFDALLPVNPGMPAPARIGRTAVNWLWTNRFGMYFALPFGAAVMTLLGQTATPRRFSSTPANILCGAVAGAPLGVCTNCATPIGQSLLAGGASTRLTVAAMVSSPMLNPVVLAMAFYLFPLPLALTRLAVPAVLLAILPWLVTETQLPMRLLTPPEPPSAPALRLRAWSAVYARNFVRLTLLTLPWMLLAALLGAAASQLIPAYGTHLAVSPVGVAAVAILGTLLPVPMAFDVALAFLLYRSGIPAPYATALLCTLGPVSVYSLAALARQIDRVTSLRLAGAVALLGSVAGWLVLGAHIR